MSQDEIKNLRKTPMSAFIVEDSFRIKMARRLFVRYIDYTIPNKVLTYLKSTSTEQLYIYIFTPQNRKLYITSFERRNRLEVINLFNLSSFPTGVELIRYPLVSLETKIFTSEKQITDYIIKRLIPEDAYMEKPSIVSNPKQLDPNNELEDCKAIANTNRSGLSEIISSVDKKLTNISSIEDLLDTSEYNKDKAQHIIKCHYGKDKKRVSFERDACYDSWFLGKKITNTGIGNYYVNNGRDVIIIVPQNTINIIRNKNEYELVGSGQDPRFHQIFGRNANEKVRSQSLLGTRILVFYIDSRNHLYFYDEVEYLNYKILSSEKYQKEIIVFSFKSILS